MICNVYKTKALSWQADPRQSPGTCLGTGLHLRLFRKKALIPAAAISTALIASDKQPGATW